MDPLDWVGKVQCNAGERVPASLLTLIKGLRLGRLKFVSSIVERFLGLVRLSNRYPPTDSGRINTNQWDFGRLVGDNRLFMTQNEI